MITLDPFFYDVMPGDDDVIILGNPTLKLLGIDIGDSLGARARERAALTGVEPRHAGGVAESPSVSMLCRSKRA